jgi:hypothetical protein
MDILNNIRDFKDLSDEYKSTKLCIEVLSKKPSYIKYTPIKYVSQEGFMHYVINKNPHIFAFMDPKYMTNILIDLAVSKDSDNLEYVPNNFKTEELFFKYINEDINNIKYFPNYRQQYAIHEGFYIQIIIKSKYMFNLVDNSAKYFNKIFGCKIYNLDMAIKIYKIVNDLNVFSGLQISGQQLNKLYRYPVVIKTTNDFLNGKCFIEECKKDIYNDNDSESDDEYYLDDNMFTICNDANVKIFRDRLIVDKVKLFKEF